MGRVLYPPKIVGLRKRAIFLAGPIQGAEDWQKDAIKIIHSQYDQTAVICNPRRNIKFKGQFRRRMYEQQVDWETYFLKLCAANDGVLLFWMAKEKEHSCERAFAQTTRAELFEWKVWNQQAGVKLAVGIEDGYTGARYIRRRFAKDNPDVIIRSDLVKTCLDAALLLNC